MAEVLTTKGLSAALEDLIRKAEKEVFLISYSFKISEGFIKRIRQSVERGVIIKIVYGTSINKETLNELKSIPNLQILHCPNLHAKIYANENKCIIGSMNFYDYSELNNTELGVLLTPSADTEAFKDAITHCREIVQESDIEMPLMPKSIHDKHMLAHENNLKTSPKKIGYCIRSGARIPLNHQKPLSSDSYTIWSLYSDDEYPEKFCHFSGEPSNGNTSMASPVLSKNWKNYLNKIAALD